MSLLSRQSANRTENFFSRQLYRIFDRHAFDHFGKGGSAHECRRTAVGQKARGFNPAVLDAQGQAHPVAADWIRFFGNGVCVRKFSCVARIREVIFETF